MWHIILAVRGSALVAIAICSGVARAQGVHSVQTVQNAQNAQTMPSAPSMPRLAISLPGSSTYANYTPFACSLASDRFGAFAAGARRLTWRDRWPATAATRLADSLAQDSAKQVANRDVRRCLAQHSIARTRTEHLLGLGMAWIDVDDDAHGSLAFRTLVQRMARAPLAERAFALQQIVNTYAGRGGAKFDTALAFMRELDALGKGAAGYRLTARNVLYGVASMMDSLPLMIEHARIGLALQQTITGDEQREWLRPSMVAVVNQADVEARQGNYKVAVERLALALKAFQQVDPGVAGWIIGGALQTTVPLGSPVPALKATYAYAATGSAPMTTPLVAPVKGRVSLFVRGPFPSFMPNDYSLFRTILEFQEKFGSSIDIVVLGDMVGYKGPKKITAVEEAPLFEDFYHTYLRLKLPIVVYNRPITGKRDDGALIRDGNPNDHGLFVLVNKRGEFRNITSGFGIPRLRWMHLIEEALRE